MGKPGEVRLEKPRIQEINAVQGTWLPASGHAAAPGGGAPDFLERYGEKFDPVSGTGDLEVWFPIR